MNSSPDRRALRSAIADAYPWVGDPELGPRAVEAGECDRCGREPRFVPTCGPVEWEALCPACASEIGAAAWCEGHRAEGRRALDAVAGLPPEWALVARLWWVATGEVRLDRLVISRPERLAAQVQAALGRGASSDG